MKPSAPMPTMEHTVFISAAKSSQEYYEKGDLENALKHCMIAANMNPTIAELASTCGAILHDMGKYQQALVWHRRACALKYSRPEIYSNHANTLRAMGDLQSAHYWNWKALRKSPDNSMVWNNQGCVDTELGDISAALDCFDHAIAADAKNYMAYFNRGNAMLLRDNLDPLAWDFYYYRSMTNLNSIQKLPFPFWAGEDLNHLSIFIEVEQGAGDTFQFCRYIIMLREKYPRAHITFQVADPLYNIISKNLWNVCDVVPGVYTIKEPYDFRCILMDLPRHFTYEVPSQMSERRLDVPNSPYLKAPNVEKPLNGKISVGLCWKGNPSHKNDHNRSIHDSKLLWHLVDLQNTYDNIQMFSLQPGNEIFSERSGEVAPSRPMETWEQTFDFIAALDLIITVDTAIAHAAGAMGKLVWLMVPKAPDWRWMQTEDTSIWYPSMKIYRQELRGRWDTVIDKVHEDLAALVSSGTPNRHY